MKALLIALSLVFMSGCSIAGGLVEPVTKEKAVYFYLQEGTMNAHGIHMNGTGIKYHSAPCPDGDCAHHSHHGDQ